MDINLVGIQEPKGFDNIFNNGYPITELENNEIEAPYYESEFENDSEVSYIEQYETESDCASSEDGFIVKRTILRSNRERPMYKTILCVETDFLPE